MRKTSLLLLLPLPPSGWRNVVAFTQRNHRSRLAANQRTAAQNDLARGKPSSSKSERLPTRAVRAVRPAERWWSQGRVCARACSLHGRQQKFGAALGREESGWRVRTRTRRCAAGSAAAVRTDGFRLSSKRFVLTLSNDAWTSMRALAASTFKQRSLRLKGRSRSSGRSTLRAYPKSKQCERCSVGLT